jgi:hypothetical protein
MTQMTHAFAALLGQDVIPMRLTVKACFGIQDIGS